MEGVSGEVVVPTIDQICGVNRRMIESFGGRFLPPTNFQKQGSLESILAMVSSPLLAEDPYPTLKEKACAIAYQIITRHVFVDGNHRTAMHMAWEFLQGNGVGVTLEPSINDLPVAIANGEAGYGELLRWLHDHQ